MIDRRPAIVLAAFALAIPAAIAAQQRTELPARDNMLSGPPARMWSIGADEGETWEMFAGITSLAFDANDNLYVLDAGNHRVLVFDRDGEFVRQFGKQGGGPGEFQFPFSIAVARDGSIAVYDGGRRAFVVFSPDGTFRDQVPLPDDVGSARADEIRQHPQGGLVLRAAPRIDPQSPPTDSMISPIIHMPLAGRPGEADVIYDRFKVPPPRIITPAGGAGGRQIRMMVSGNQQTFAVTESWGMLPDGRLVIRDTDDYTLRLMDAAGRPERTITRPIPAHRVTKRDQDAAKERRRQQLREGGGDAIRVTSSGGGGGGRAMTFSTGPGGAAPGEKMSEEQIQAQLDQMTFADVIPSITRIDVDPTGRVWITRRPDRVGGDAPIDLLRADGSYIGTIAKETVPRAVSSSGLAAYIEANELDIQQVVVKRLPGTWR